MTRDEHRQCIQSLLGMVAAEHQADASEILNNLSNDYNTTIEDLETERNNVQSLTQRNERLREVNADLFLQVGTSKKAASEESEETQQETTLDFKNLFNEKGELK